MLKCITRVKIELERKKSEMIEVWIDGCCMPVNPEGTACLGYVMKRNGMVIAQGSQIVGEGKGMTSNVAEYHALIRALEEIHQRKFENETILIKSDSNLLVNQMNEDWKVKAPLIKPLYWKARRLTTGLKLKLEWIPRELNEEADELSRVAYKDKLKEKTREKHLETETRISSEQRTFPGFLTSDEAGREASRLEEMVRSFRSSNQVERIGESKNFIVDFDKSQQILLLYGKESLGDCPFKIALRKEEIDSIVALLSKGKKHL